MQNVKNKDSWMQKIEEKIDLKLIELLCILSILNELQSKPVTKEFQKLSIKNILD